ncbi:hypothetical protein AVEN_133815-1 [Araneus ventricosus]|uniref:Uncharacterized protein n=1 Tax=Araneus ventricosus TaxID=182803 RepID=A0A4Y2QZ81_ARAVE|nr:hypothetical protein AVEN_133815-1 [Araneus ventricosus]
MGTNGGKLPALKRCSSYPRPAFLLEAITGLNLTLPLEVRTITGGGQPEPILTIPTKEASENRLSSPEASHPCPRGAPRWETRVS